VPRPDWVRVIPYRINTSFFKLFKICLSVCILDAVKYNWEEVESADLQERVAEHAHGVNQGKREKSFPLNFSDFYDPGMPLYWKKAG